jgi:hypothetical protein
MKNLGAVSGLCLCLYMLHVSKNLISSVCHTLQAKSGLDLHHMSLTIPRRGVWVNQN